MSTGPPLAENLPSPPKELDALDHLLAGTNPRALEVASNLPAVIVPHPLEGVEDVNKAAIIIGQLLTEEKAGTGKKVYPRRILRQQHIAAYMLINPFATTTEICSYFGIGVTSLYNITKSDTFKALVAAHKLNLDTNVLQDIHDQLRQTLSAAIEVTQDAIVTHRDPDYALTVLDKTANRLGLGAKHNTNVQINNNIVTAEMLAEARARRLGNAR